MSEPMDPLEDTIECLRITWMDGEQKFVRFNTPMTLTATSLQFSDDRGITEWIPLYQVRNIERVTIQVGETNE